MSKYIRFDWAIKRILRQKANFVVLEGLISTLLEKDIKIDCLLESESNQDSDDDKQNRVDILTQDVNGEKYIIEVQNARETAYFHRMLFGTSKAVTEYLHKGDDYGQVKKVYSINIVYFELGNGKDYIYKGTTEFRGIHDGELLNLTPFQVQTYKKEHVSDIFPEYYVLKVNGFNDVAVTPLDEWIDFLKNDRIKDNPTAPGLKEAKEIMQYDMMTPAEQQAYDRHLDNIVILRDQINTAVGEARMEARAEGRAEGIIATARNLKNMGLSVEQIQQATNLTEEEILKL